MISWLKKYGLTILKDVGIVLGIAQAATAASGGSNTVIQQDLDLAGKIFGLVQQAEVIGVSVTPTMTGPQKFSAVAGQVPQLVQTWLADNFPGTAKIGDKAKFQLACNELAQGMVDLANSIENDPTSVQAVKGV